MESPAHMPPLHTYWKINRYTSRIDILRHRTVSYFHTHRPPLDKVKGKLRHEQTQSLLKQWEYNIAKPKVYS